MSALDKVRSFAEARVAPHQVIAAGLTYGDAREIQAELATLRAKAALADQIANDLEWNAAGPRASALFWSEWISRYTALTAPKETK